MSRIFFLLEKKNKTAYVLGYLNLEFVFLRKTWNMPIVKLSVFKLVLFSAAALSNKKSDLLVFNPFLIYIFHAVMNADNCLLSQISLVREKLSNNIFKSN